MTELGSRADGANISTQPSLKSQEIGNRSIRTEAGNEVSVAWRKFAPKQLAPDAEGRAVLFFPGWVMQAKAVSVEDLPQSFADESGTQAIAIDTSPKKAQLDYQEEARATLNLLLESGIKEVVLAGHSNGAIKACELELLLKQLRGTPQEIKVNGLVLLDSTHLYDQNPAALPGKFVKVSAQEMIHEEKNKASQAAGADFAGALKERVQYSGSIGEYLKVMVSQGKDMSKINPRLSEVDVPIVLFSSDKNPIADYRKVAPIDTLPTQPFKTTVAQREAMSEQELKDREQVLATNMANRVENRKRREHYLKGNRFKSAPNIRVIVPRAYHNTLPTHRFEGAAKAGLYYLNQLPSQRQKAA